MIFKRLREEIESIRARDPAARSGLEVVLCYSGFHVMLFYRLAHAIWQAGFLLPARMITHIGKFFSAIEIHPGAVIGRRLFIDHGNGVVIGETAVIGDDVTLYHGVTLGGTASHGSKRHPTLGDGVIVGAGAKILGPVTVGDGARVGANAVVLSDVPPGVTVVGIPARVVLSRSKSEGFHAYGCDTDLPDPMVRVVESLDKELTQLQQRIDRLEARNAAEPGDGMLPALGRRSPADSAKREPKREPS